MTAKKFYMPRYIAFWSLDITDYITIKTGYVHFHSENFNEYIPSYITCYVAHNLILVDTSWDLFAPAPLDTLCIIVIMVNGCHL